MNMQVSLTLNEVAKLLRERYGTRSMSEALERFIADTDKELMRKGRDRAEELVSERDKRPEKLN